MTRPSRTFKLRLSPAGMDLLIESHCHLIRSTRSMLAWGTTLQIAVEHLDTVPAGIVADRLQKIAAAGYAGREDYHLGAPRGVNETAARIAARVSPGGESHDAPTLAHVYLAALEQLVATDAAVLRTLHDRIRQSVP
jgi:hypothetical protein